MTLSDINKQLSTDLYNRARRDTLKEVAGLAKKQSVIALEASCIIASKEEKYWGEIALTRSSVLISFARELERMAGQQ